MQLKRKLSDDESKGASTPTRTVRDSQTPSSEDSTKPKLDRQPLRNVQVSFAVDISGSTYGSTLSAEKAFIKGVANLLAPQARFSSKILPWDNRAHPTLSLGQVNSLEDSGGTDPGVLLTDRRHKAALKECSLWFLMTDGLIPPESRAKFARDVTAQGLHGISCVIVVFGNPKTGPSSCDISVGVGVFAVVPNCAFLFCDETTGDLRAMQTKGTFNALLKGQPHPVFDSSSRWDLLPQVSIADFATISIPDPQGLGADQVALQDSLVINMNDLFANRLSTDEINKIFDNGDNLDSIRLTMQARNQQEDFRHWLQQQAIRPDDPLVIPRRDIGHKAESLFGELVDLISRGQSPPDPLQARLRAAYRENMRGFIRRGEREHHNSEQRSEMITQAAFSSYTPTDASPALSPSTRGVNRYDRQVMGAGTVSAPVSALPRRLDWSNSELPSITPQAQIMAYPQVAPGAPPRSPPRRRDSGHASAIPYPPRYQPMEEPWGSWESKITNPTLRGLLYTTGLRSTKGSFKGTCPACGTKDITMAWLFRAPAPSTPFKPPTPGGTEGFPRPGSRTRLAFPLAMGHFTETSGVLASITPISTPITATSSSQSAQMPSLVCDPCSHFYTRNGALSFGITTALPLVRFSENREAICNILATAFNDRFDRGDLPQVFLSVLMLAADHAAAASTPRTQQFSPPSERDFDISATFKAAAALRTLRSAIEWAARDLLYSVVALRELSESFSLPSDTSGAVWPLATVLAGSFEELDAGLEGKAHSAAAVPLLRYPLPGFVTILKTAPLVGISEQTRRRAAFRRLLFLICEELEKAAGQVPHSQSVGEAFGGLLGRPHSVASTGKEGAKPETPWEPALSVSIQSLRFTSLLGAASYVMLSRTEEFRHLEEPLASAWVGSGLALFLHTLFAVVTKGGSMKALDMFQDVMKVKLVASALQRPEEIEPDTVQEVLAQLL